MLNALLYLAEREYKWRGLSELYGPWRTVYMRLSRRAKTGALERVVTELQCDQIAVLELDALSLDSTINKLHVHGMGAPRNRAPSDPALGLCPWLEQRAV